MERKIEAVIVLSCTERQVKGVPKELHKIVEEAGIPVEWSSVNVDGTLVSCHGILLMNDQPRLVALIMDKFKKRYVKFEVRVLPPALKRKARQVADNIADAVESVRDTVEHLLPRRDYTVVDVPIVIDESLHIHDSPDVCEMHSYNPSCSNHQELRGSDDVGSFPMPELLMTLQRNSQRRKKSTTKKKSAGRRMSGRRRSNKQIYK